MGNRSAAAVPMRDQLPVRVDRKTGAELVTKLYFRVSDRTLERWPLPWRRINGRAHVETSLLFAEAERRLADAPEVKAA